MLKVSQDDLLNRETYYDYMKRRSREEDEKLRIDNNTAYPYKGWSQDDIVSDLKKRVDKLRKDIDAYLQGKKH